ncbi:AAA family ATPase, partial [Chlamydiales bacterium]|nr:AAA family ATPase [Chlamydiales bacterium]
CFKGKGYYLSHSLTERVRGLGCFSTPIKDECKSLFSRVSKDPKYRFNENETRIIRESILKKISIEEIKDLSASQIGQVLNVWVNDAMDGVMNQSPTDSDLELLNLDKLLELLSLDTVAVDHLIKTQKSHSEKALQSVLKVKATKTLKEIIPEFCHQVNRVVDNLIGSLGVYEIFEENSQEVSFVGESLYRSKQKIEIYLKLILLPETIFIVLSAYVSTPAMAVAMTLFAITTLLIGVAAYAKYLRPCPQSCQGLRNLTLELLKKENKLLTGREDIIKKIQKAHESKKGVILIGEPGCGKTSIVESIAKRAKGSYLFHCNAAEIAGDYRDTTFGQVRKQFTKYENEVIFFFDEIQALFKKNDLVPGRVTSMLTFCDQFPHIIVATTKKEYEEYIKDKEPAFLRRFIEPIELQPLKDQEIEVALYDDLDKKHPELLLEEGVISYIVSKAHEYQKNTSKVDAAFSLLSAALTKATNHRLEKIESEINQLTLQINHREQEYSHAHLSQVKGFSNEVIQELRGALKEKEEILIKHEEEVGRLLKMQFTYIKRKHELFEIANKPSLRSKWIRMTYLQTLLESAIVEKRKALNIPPCLNKALIDEIL